MNYDIREYRKSDLPSLRTIYSCSIRDLGESAYSKKQVAAWSSLAEDIDTFREWIESASTFVAVSGDDGCIGFAGMENSGRIASVFVIPAHMRNGVGSMLVQHLIEETRTRGFTAVTTEASEFSKPLFEKFGFRVVEVQCTEFKGVEFNRHVMRANI